MLHNLSDSELLHFIQTEDPEEQETLFAAAREVRAKHYGNAVYLRGLIEFSNYCKQDCYYCGLRKSNLQLERYRLTPAQILDCCREGDSLGFRTFVLQSGEDPWFTDERVVQVIHMIRESFPNHAITLSIGERSHESYVAFYKAGANRFLLRHETASDDHYRQLHPATMSSDARKKCLRDLKQIGFQAGAGFMVGSPFQTPEHLLEDLRFIRELQPHMVGIGPFIPQADTPFGGYPQGSLELTLRMVALARLVVPEGLIPATTALGSISPKGRERGLKAGANVVMPNLSPTSVREQYAIYNNKICTGDEAAKCRYCIERRIQSAGFEVDMARGDNALVSAAG